MQANWQPRRAKHNRGARLPLSLQLPDIDDPSIVRLP